MIVLRGAYHGPARVKELRGYVEKIWGYRKWKLWIENDACGVHVHIGGANAEGFTEAAYSFHGKNRQQALFRCRLVLLSLLRAGSAVGLPTLLAKAL